jgi:hypothetical protein
VLSKPKVRFTNVCDQIYYLNSIKHVIYYQRFTTVICIPCLKQTINSIYHPVSPFLLHTNFHCKNQFPNWRNVTYLTIESFKGFLACSLDWANEYARRSFRWKCNLACTRHSTAIHRRDARPTKWSTPTSTPSSASSVFRW